MCERLKPTTDKGSVTIYKSVAMWSNASPFLLEDSWLALQKM